MPAAFALLLALLPVWVALTPLALLGAARERRGRARSGLGVLTPAMATTLRAYAEAWIGAQPPFGGWQRFAQQTDRYLALSHGPRSWLMPVLLTAMEFAPWCTLRRRFSALPVATRRMLCEHYYLRPGHLTSPLAWSRQLVRLGYHSTPEEAARAGFVPPEQRGEIVASEPGRMRVSA